MEPDQSGGQMDVGLNAEMTRVTEESAGGSGSNQMAILQMQLRITEMELAMEQLRNENGARAATVVQSTEADRSEDRRLRYASLLIGVLVPLPTQESLVPSWFDDVEATFDCYDVPGVWRAGFVLPRLSEKARGLLVRLSADERKDYYVLKEAMLKGLHLSSSEYRGLFTQSKECGDENEAPAKIMLPLEIAELAESFEESRRGMTNSSEVARGESPKLISETRRAPPGASKMASKKSRGCFVCSSMEHFARDCPTVRVGRANLVRTDNPNEGRGVMVEAQALESAMMAPKFHAIETVNLVCGESEFKGSIDSGAGISGIRKSVVPGYEPTRTNMKLMEAFVVWGWRLPGDSHKQTRVGGGMRWPARIAECFGEVCLQVRPRAQVAMVAGTFPSTPRTYVVQERTASTTRTAAAAASPTSSGPRFMTWGTRYSEQPRWPATTTVVRVNQLWLKTPLAEPEQTPHIGVLRRDCRGGQGRPG
ncbi:hypothetical protein HPB50_012775 [Hyalomma asiaticum]|uniref:Uncharacterized protein n=1 Tax=Hyalomma asiaticum TaxID=266040 RepID=A0ACB7RU97_HYAAI|nr:hypothetical protein HPB50_012775 [Hyalomma asiaticum]